MTAPMLAIQAEAWLQEELGAQRALLQVLTRIEVAVRGADGAELERCGRELAGLVALGAAREARRRALLGRLASELGLAARELNLTRICAALVKRGIDAQRIQDARGELRAATAATVKLSRRLCALAQYHRGLLEELCQLFLADAPAEAGGHLIDARG